MNKKIQKLLYILWGGVFLLLVFIMVRYYEGNRVSNEKKEMPDQLLIMATYETQPYQEALRIMAERYMTSTKGIEINFLFVEQSDFQKELCIDKDQENLPDLIICENTTLPALVSMGILRDLTQESDYDKISQFLKTSYAGTLVNGKCYAFPLTCDPYVLFYNKDYLDKYEVGVPVTMEEFFEITMEHKTFGNYNFGMALESREDVASCFLQLVYSFGGNIRELGSPQAMELYNMLEKMKSANILPQDIINWNQTELMEYFADGMVTMAVARLSSLSILKQKETGFHYGISELPYAQKQSFLMHGENIGITVSADYEQALQFSEYLTSKEGIEEFTRMTHTLSVRNDILYNPASKEGLRDEFVQNQRDRAVLKSTYSSWFVISGAITDNLIAFFGDNSKKAQDLADKMQEEVRLAILER